MLWPRLAFISYSKGLDFEDKGMFRQARQEYLKAVQIDPNFALARENLSAVDTNESAAAEPKVAASKLEEDLESSEVEVGDSGRISRLVTTGFAAQTGQTPQGDNDTRETVQEVTDTDKALPTASIRIRVRLPGGLK